HFLPNIALKNYKAGQATSLSTAAAYQSRYIMMRGKTAMWRFLGRQRMSVSPRHYRISIRQMKRYFTPQDASLTSLLLCINCSYAVLAPIICQIAQICVKIGRAHV